MILPGNHDYYGGNLHTLDRDLERICQGAGCAFRQCLRLVLGDTRILMTTLWTDMRLSEAEGEAAVVILPRKSGRGQAAICSMSAGDR